METFKINSLPELNESQFYIILAELKTGIVINLDEKYNVEPENYPILLFNSYNEAKDFAERKVTENFDIEYSIYNHKKEFIERTFTNL